MGKTLLEQVDGLSEVITAARAGDGARIAGSPTRWWRPSGAPGSTDRSIPASLGGDDRHLLEVLEAIERIASFDGSIGWCAAISSGSNLFSGYLAREEAAKVCADPDQGNAGMFGPLRPGACQRRRPHAVGAVAVLQQLAPQRVDRARHLLVRRRRRARADPSVRARADGRRHHRVDLGRPGSLRDRQPPRVGRRGGGDP